MYFCNCGTAVCFVWYIFRGDVSDHNAPSVNILNVEIKIRNVPYVSSQFHRPEDEWLSYSLNGFYQQIECLSV